METKEIMESLHICISPKGCGGCIFESGEEDCGCSERLMIIAAERLEELENKNRRLSELLVRTTALDGGRAQRPSPTMEWISVEDEPLPKLSWEVNKMLYRCPNDLPLYIAFYGNGASNGVTHWMQLDPPKPKEPTFKDVFFEKFPKTKVSKVGTPFVCRKWVFGYPSACPVKINSDINKPCDACWGQPYFEEEGEEE